MSIVNKTTQETWRSLHSSAAAKLFPAGALHDEGDRPGAAAGHRSHDPNVEYITYGPPLSSGEVIEIPATYGSVELEYAAIRRKCGIMDCPHRGTIRVTGTDRIEFLNRMVTQELKGMASGDVRQAFWLNRKGRIEADLLLFQREDDMLIDVDRHDVVRTVETLDAFLFSDDVTLADVTSEMRRMTVFGPDAPDVLADYGQSAVRNDMSDTTAFEVFISAEEAAGAWTSVLERARPVGWYAFNVARIESGIPVMHVDFNGEHLPHETGLLHRRVSFKKGCYLGQEIVARMESRGKPKQVVVGLVMHGDALPVEGTHMFAVTDDGSLGDPVGVVTSSTLSPMRGAQPIALAMVRSKFAEPGTRLRLAIDATLAEAEVVTVPFLESRQQGGVQQ